MIPKIPADIFIPDPLFGMTAVITLLPGLLFLVFAGKRMWQGKPGRASAFAILALLSGSGAAVLLLAAINIHTYQRLSHESTVGEIHFSRLRAQLYQADMQLTRPVQRRHFKLSGDQWQLDVRIIKWTGPFIIAGFNSIYRLDRIQGRYRNIDQARAAPRTVHALNNSSMLDLWSIIQQYRKYLPWLDAYYGSATYLPMTDGSRFRISISQSGLIARPVNTAARQAVDSWGQGQ